MGTGYEVSEAEKKAFANEAEKDKELRDKMAQALTGPNGEKADTSGSAKAKPAAKGAMKAKYGQRKKSSASSSKASKSSASKGGGSSFDPLNGDIP